MIPDLCGAIEDTAADALESAHLRAYAMGAGDWDASWLASSFLGRGDMGIETCVRGTIE